MQMRCQHLLHHNSWTDGHMGMGIAPWDKEWVKEHDATWIDANMQMRLLVIIYDWPETETEHTNESKAYYFYHTTTIIWLTPQP